MADSRDQPSGNDLVNLGDMTTEHVFESAKQSDSPPSSPSSKRDHMSNSETNEKKRSRQETASQEYVAPESLRALRPAAADNSYPLLAPRATYTQEQFNTGVQHAYLGDSGVPRTAGTRKLKQIPEDDISEEVYARMSRSERKRYREKKRRSEVNKGFDDLTALLLKVEYVTHPHDHDISCRRQISHILTFICFNS